MVQTNPKGKLFLAGAEISLLRFASTINVEALPAQKYRPYNTQFPILSWFVIAFELSHLKRQA